MSQLSNKIEHALRAYTPKEIKAVKTAAESFRANPAFDTAELLQQLGTGEAIVSLLDTKGIPTPCEHAYILPPESLMGTITETARHDAVVTNVLADKYTTQVDNDSAYEYFERRRKQLDDENAAAAEAKAQSEADAKAKEAADKEAAKAEAAAAKQAAREAAAAEKARAKSEANSRNAVKSSAKNVASTTSGTIGREIGKAIGSSVGGSFGKRLGGNVGASIGRNIIGTLFKLYVYTGACLSAGTSACEGYRRIARLRGVGAILHAIKQSG